MKTRFHFISPLRALCLLCLLAAVSSAPAQTIIYNPSANNFHNTLDASATGTCYIFTLTDTWYSTPGHWRFSDVTFDNNGLTGAEAAAITVDGGGAAGAARFSATNITALATGNSSGSTDLSSDFRRAALVVRNSGSAFISGGTLRQQGASDVGTGRGYAVYLQNGSRLTAADILIEATGPRVHAVVVGNHNASLLQLTRSAILNSGSAAALWLAGSGVTLLDSSTIATAGAVAPAVLATVSRPRFALDGGLITATGAGSPGIWLSGSLLLADFTIMNGVVSSAQAAAIEVNIDHPGLLSRSGITGAASHWQQQHKFTIVSSTIAGAAGSLRLTSSATSGATVAEIPTSVLVHASENTLFSDAIHVLDGARLDLRLDDSTLAAPLAGTGTAPVVNLSLARATVAAGIALSGGAALNLGAANSVITGGLDASGGARAALTLSEGSTLDAITLTGSAVLAVSIAGGASLGSASATQNSTFVLASVAGAPVVFHGSLAIADRARWRVSGKTTLENELALAGEAPSITLVNAFADQLTLNTGVTGAGRLAIEGLDKSALGKTELRVIRDLSPEGLAPGTFTLIGASNSGLFTYRGLDCRPDGAYLTRGGFTTAGVAILDTPALAAADNFAALDLASPATGAAAPQIRNPQSAIQNSPTPGAFFLATRATQTKAGGAAPGLAFTQHTYALAAGADIFLTATPSATLAAGFAADTALAKRDFDAGPGAGGRSTTFGAAASLRHTRASGLALAAAVRVAQTQNTLDTRDTGAALHATYKTIATTAQLTAAWRLAPFANKSSPLLSTLALTPGLSAAVARLDGATYQTSSANEDNRFAVTLASATATRLRAALDTTAALSERWSLRAALAWSRLGISGGEITAPGVAGADFQLDGARAEVTAGLVRRLTQNSALTLDYTHARAADYTAPWSLSLAYTRAW